MACEHASRVLISYGEDHRLPISANRLCVTNFTNPYLQSGPGAFLPLHASPAQVARSRPAVERKATPPSALL